MGAHKMASQGGNGGGGGGGSGGRQGSTAYSVALNEVETHLSEPLHTMNLEDLLRHVLPSDLGGAATSAAGDSLGHVIEHLVGASAPSGAEKKMVDDVWRDIHRGGRRRRRGGGAGAGERPPALGEVTLEDFLSRAGATIDGGGGDWVQRNHQQQAIMGIYINRPLGAAAAAPGRKRGAAAAAAAATATATAEEAAEKTVERRQKRRIKNRESAARSRARRQAYTNELENKVSRLEEENERLRKQKKWEPIVRYLPQQEQKQQLRRTSSAPF